MRIPFWAVPLICLVMAQNSLSAQDKLAIKFGKVAPEDFNLSKYSYDTGAAAVIIADIGSTSFEGNNKGYFSLVFKRYKRIKIVNKNGFGAASDEIEVYSDGLKQESLTDLKAVTYNLENGQILETKLDEKSIFTDKITKKGSLKKFTMPAVKEGSIVEISYTVKSDFYTYLRAWDFQGHYPCLWSEYQVSIPEYFHYMKVNQGDQNFFIDTVTGTKEYYTIRVSGGTESDDIYDLKANVIQERWVKKDVPAIRREAYITTLRNYIARVEFQLNYVQYTPTTQRYDYMGSWYIASEKLLKDDQFGKALDDDNRWMEDELKSILAGSTDELEKTQRIYAYVRDHFSCSDYDGIYADKSLKTVFKNKTGNVAEINLLLTALLRHENINTDPVILSTRDNGYPSEVYPIMDRFNYVICAAHLSSKTVYLDASRPQLGFGHLPEDCYNGAARIVNKEKPFVIYFNPDSVKERTVTSVLIVNDDKGFPSGTLQTTLGLNESYELREKIRKSSQKDYFKDIQTAYGSDLELDNPQGIDSLTKLDCPVKVYYDFNLKSLTSEDIIYFSPMLAEAYKKDPFTPAVRTYPVEIPYTVDETYTLNMEIPAGYEVDELPKSARVLLNETEGSFEYLIQKNATSIQMRSRIILNKAVFAPEEYSVLRDFFAYVVKKHGEQIVFKKKK
jgi:hypothetical protein